MAQTPNYHWPLPADGDGTGNDKPWGDAIRQVITETDSLLHDAEDRLTALENPPGPPEVHPYVVGVTYNGKPEANLVAVRHPFPIAVSLAQNALNSTLILETAPSAELVVSLQKNGVEFGTATFAIGQNTAVFACPATNFTAGDVLKAIFPAQDSTAANLGGCLFLTR